MESLKLSNACTHCSHPLLHELAHHQASLTEAEDALNSVFRRRKGRYGPHGMRKRIKEVSEKGWPVLFKVSAERARRLVDHPHSDMPPGLKMGDHVKIEGSPSVYRLVTNTGRPSYMESVKLGLAQKKERLMIRIEGLDQKEDADKVTFMNNYSASIVVVE